MVGHRGFINICHFQIISVLLLSINCLAGMVNKEGHSFSFKIPESRGGGFAKVKIERMHGQYNLILRVFEIKNKVSVPVVTSQVPHFLSLKNRVRNATLELWEELVDERETGSLFVSLKYAESNYTNRLILKFQFKKDRTGWDLVWLSRKVSDSSHSEITSCVVNLLGNNFAYFQPELSQLSFPQPLDLYKVDFSQAGFSVFSELENKHICENVLSRVAPDINKNEMSGNEQSKWVLNIKESD